MGFFRHLQNVIRFMQLPEAQRRLTFYSEGKNYWPHLECLVTELLATSDIPVCYISSADDDPGLFLEHANYHSFKIDEGFVRNWLFENIETDVMVMTMPDLHQYQVKRSKHKVHYIYVQHSLVSQHMAYRKGAFDYYDTIFCAGPHHIKEIRAMEERYQQPEKKLLEHGYGRLDAIIETAKKNLTEKNLSDKAPLHVLIAPSWGPEGMIESGIAQNIVDLLIRQGCQVTLRPHPQTLKFAKDKIDNILQKHDQHMLFTYEANVAGQDSLHESDMMFSDWSGAALDYAFGLKKPVMFIDVPRKVNNPEYEKLKIEPFESFIRDEIGRVIPVGEKVFPINECLSSTIKCDLTEHVFNPENSSRIGAQYIIQLVQERIQ